MADSDATPSDGYADRQFIEHLYARGVLTQDGRAQALDILYPADQWMPWISRLLLMAGIALVLSGVVYFFAFNWAAITPAVKFTAIECALFASLLAAWLYGLETTEGKVFNMTAGVLVGVFLAVFGQVYQTGADAWQLFATWALLIAPLAIIGDFIGLWAVWLVVANTGFMLWWQQWLLLPWGWENFGVAVTGLFNAALYAGYEIYARRGHDWLHHRLAAPVFMGGVVLAFFIPAFWMILDIHAYAGHDGHFWGGVIGIAAHIAFYLIYRFIDPDIRRLTLVWISTTLLVETAGIRMIHEMESGWFSATTLLLMGLWTVAVFTASFLRLRVTMRLMERKA